MQLGVGNETEVAGRHGSIVEPSVFMNDKKEDNVLASTHFRALSLHFQMEISHITTFFLLSKKTIMLNTSILSHIINSIPNYK